MVTSMVAKFLESLANYSEGQDTNKKKDEKDKSGGKDESVQLKDFTWDQFIKYISSAILVLTLLNVVEQFFRDGNVFCFHPSDTVSFLPSVSARDDMVVYEFARDQATFINSYCIGSVPVTEYFPLYILIHGILLLAPHYIWSSVFKGDFDSFFAIEGKIDHLRDSTTGEYKEESFDRVKKLEKEYGAGHRRIFRFYVLKLLAQLTVCVASFVISAVWLKDFSYSFNCPRSLEENSTDIPDEWPLNVTVPCVYTSLRVLRVVRVADFVLTAVVAVLALYGLFWCGIRHTDQLGQLQVAKFSFQSGLKPEAFSADPVIQFKSNKYLGIIRKHYETNWLIHGLFWIFTRQAIRIRPQNFFSHPRISTDLDFLVMLLFKAEASRGKVFKNLLVCT